MRCAFLLLWLAACATTGEDGAPAGLVLQGCVYGAAQATTTAMLQAVAPADGGRP